MPTVGVDNVKAVEVGNGVTVGRAVFVAAGASAVWVWKIAATIVSAFAAIVALISGVGWSGAQAASNIPMRSNVINDRRVMIHLICEF